MREEKNALPDGRRFLDVKRWWRVILGWGLVALGGLFVLLGWFGVSGEPSVARQMSYLASGGLGGLAFAVVGAALLISEDLRSERRRLGRIESALLDVQEMLRAQVHSRSDGSKSSRTQRTTGSARSRRRSR